MPRRTPVSSRGNGPHWLLLLLALGLLGLIFATQRTLDKAARALSAAPQASELPSQSPPAAEKPPND
jgi:hypothetical protein